MKLTKTNIDKATYTGSGSSPCFIWDDEIHGFGLRIYPSGKKTFVLDYRMDQRQHRIVLGAYGAITLQQARDIARDRLYEILKGINPLEKRKEASKALLITELCEKYIEYSRKRKRSWQQDVRRINGKIIPAFGSRKVISIKRSDIISFHDRIGSKDARPYEANRVLALCSSLFGYAIKNDLVPPEFINPATGIEKFREEKRDTWVTPEMLPRLAESIDQEENIYMRTAFWLLLLTGLRKNEALTLQWDNIDFTRNIVHIPITKNGRMHELPLSTPAVDLLNKLPRVMGNKYVFPGERFGEHLVNIDKCWQRIRARAGFPNVRIHDLRRTLGSWLATDGKSLLLIGKILNHAHQSTTQVYAHLQQDPQKEALEQHAQKVIDITNLQHRKKAEGE